MYQYRLMTPQQRAEVVAERKANGYPWHAPPHFGGDEAKAYMLSAACFEHRELLVTPNRLSEWTRALLDGVEHELGGRVHAWVVQPNHYHVLASVNLKDFRAWIARKHNGKSTQWNREDRTPGRKVWHRFSDRRIRDERHFYASVNYIHANPVKHGFVADSNDWPWCSLQEYLEAVGRDVLAAWWREYPLNNYGKGWDD